MDKCLLYNGDCLEIMKDIADNSIDCIICDLPYGTSASPFDTPIPLDLLWAEYERIIKPGRAIVLFAQQPFTSFLITSNIRLYKYNWIWEKDNATNILNSHYQPLKITEDICIFGTGAASYTKKGGSLIYNPQYTTGSPYKCLSGLQKSDSAIVRDKKSKNSRILTENAGIRYPKNLIKFPRDREHLHPTQKPVALLEYLVKTYTNEGDTVLDNCMGSGTTGAACKKLNRNFTGIEKDVNYFEIAKKRIEETQESLFVNI